MAIRLTTQFRNIQNKLYQIDIHDDKYISTPVSYIAGGNGFDLNYETNGDDIIHANIVASNVNITINVTDDVRTEITSFVQDLTTSDEDRFLVLIYENGNIYWRGKIQAERIQIPDRRFSQISLYATDGLSRLESITYSNGELFYYDYATLQDHIHNIINKLGLYLNVSDIELAFVTTWYAPTPVFFEVGVRIHHDAFKEIKGTETLAYDCLTVLKQLLSRFDLRIIQQDGTFYIQQINYLHDSVLKNVIYYDLDGYSYDATASFNVATGQKLSGGLSFYREPAKSAQVQYAYKDGITSNLFGGNTIAYNTTYVDGIIPNANNEAVGISIDYFVANVAPSPYQPNTFYFIRFQFKISIGTYYLSNENGFYEWIEDNTKFVELYSRQIDINENTVFVQNIALIAPTAPVEGQFTFLHRYDTVDLDFNPYGDPEVVVDVANNFARIVYGANEQSEGTKTTNCLTGNKSGEKIELEVLLTGDKPFGGSVGRIQYYTGTEWLNTFENWGFGEDEGLNIDELLAREIVATQRKAVKFWSLTYKSDINVANMIEQRIITRAQYNAQANEWNIECFEPQYDKTGLVFTYYVESEQSTAGLPSGTTPTLPPAASIQYWQRNTAKLSTVTANDAIEVISYTQKALYAESDSDDAIEAVSSTGSALKGTSKAGVGGEFSSDLEPVKAVNSSTVTSNIAPTVIHERVVSSASDGFGVSEHFDLADSAGTVATQAKSEVSLTTAAAATLSSIKTWFLRQAGGVLTQVMKLNGLGTLNVLKNYTVSANNLPVPICYFRQSKVKLIQNTAVETTMFQNSQGTLTIPANYLTDGATIRITIMGYISTGAGQTGSIRIKLGGNTLVTNTATLPNNLVLDHVYLDAIITIRGTTGSYYAAINGHTLMLVPTGLNAPLMRSLLNATPTAIDATVDNVIDATYKFGAADAANILNITHVLIHLTNS